jgi:hypothetical protein
VFTFGFAGDLQARESMYPARMFTLPVTTSALRGWPMFYGAAAMVVLLLTAGVSELGNRGRPRTFQAQPWGIEVP